MTLRPEGIQMHKRKLLSVAVALAFVPLALAEPSNMPLEVQDDRQPVALVTTASEQNPAAGARATDQWFVGFHELPGERETYAGFPILAINDRLNFFLVQAVDGSLVRAAVLADPNVRYVEWNDPFYARADFVPNDSRYNDAGHWGSKRIGGEAAWDRTLGSTAVKVAHIDSGLNKGHQDIARYLQGYDFVNNDNDPNDESGCSYHGTHTTGTAGATINNGVGIAGMAQSTVLPIKAFYPGWLGCSGDTNALINGLQYAADQGSHLSSNSWGGGSSTGILDAIQYAHNLGTIHVAAAGNDGPCSNCVGQPWKSKASITIIVASSTSSDAQSSFSNEGPEIDVIAPGSNILSTTSGASGYGSLSGTSMAAPHVTGVAALALACDASLTFSQMESLLKSTAEDIGLTSNKQGAGLVDANAVTAAECGGGPAPQCSDGIDNDGDGLTDYPADPGCADANDNDEFNAPPAQCSDGVDNDSDGLTDYPADPGCTDANDDDETDAGGPTVVFSENFDTGAAPGWTTNGGGTLWHLNTGCSSPNSPAYHLVWADSGLCTYNVGDTGFDWAKTPAISLAGYTSATLDFMHRFVTETYSGGAYDVLTVQRSCNDSTWTTMQQWDSRNPNVSTYTAASYDVSACAGGNLWVRWTGDSIDGSYNNYEGWRVDDVSVTAS